MRNLDAYNDLAQLEFGMNYDQLGPSEQQWVKDEFDILFG